MAVQVFAATGNINTGSLITATYASTRQQSLDQINFSGRGVLVTLNLTANPGIAAGSVTLIVQGKDSASGQYYPLFTSTPVSTLTSSTTTYVVHPNAQTTPTSVQSPLPRTWNIIVKHNNGSTASYTVGASVVI